MFDTLLLKRSIAQFKKAEQSIKIIDCSATNTSPLLISVNGIKINFKSSMPRKIISLKHGLQVRIHWTPNYARDNPYPNSLILFDLSTTDFQLKHRVGYNFLTIKEYNIKIKLNDDYTIDFDHLPKNIYEWTEEDLFYYKLKTNGA